MDCYGGRRRQCRDSLSAFEGHLPVVRRAIRVARWKIAGSALVLRAQELHNNKESLQAGD
jgi:hypothetical protein